MHGLLKPLKPHMTKVVGFTGWLQHITKVGPYPRISVIHTAVRTGELIDSCLGFGPRSALHETEKRKK